MDTWDKAVEAVTAALALEKEVNQVTTAETGDIHQAHMIVFYAGLRFTKVYYFFFLWSPLVRRHLFDLLRSVFQSSFTHC